MGQIFGKSPPLFDDVEQRRALADVEKKNADVDMFIWISNRFAGGAPEKSELNFAPLLKESTPVSHDDATQVWGRIVGPGSAAAKAPDDLSEYKGTVIVGFLPYKGPTEKARMIMTYQQKPWLDCRVWGVWMSFKGTSAGTSSMPTGCMPLIWDENLKTPSGACHRISEWVAVDYYAAAKHGMMGRSASELTSILMMREECAKELSPLLNDEGFGVVALCEAALRTSGKSDRLFGDDVSLADIILFNSLSHSYGLQSFREKRGDLFRACFPKLTSFYHSMLAQSPCLREYMFSDVHTPAVYFLPWELQQTWAYKYAASDNSATAPSFGNPAVESLSESDQACYNKVSEQTKEYEALFPLVCDEHIGSDFSALYLHPALAKRNSIKDDLQWEFLQRVCKQMGVTKIEDHSGGPIPSDGPVLSWNRESTEMFIPAVYVAARKGAFPLKSASEGAKILQVVSTVRQLIGSWQKDLESFKWDSCDKSKAGKTFTNVSPGNVVFLECLLSLNEWKEGRPIIGEAETLADIYMFCFMEFVDTRLLRDGDDSWRAWVFGSFLSWDYWNDSFPLLCAFYNAKKN